MRRVSKKRGSLMRKCKEKRAAFLAEFPFCFGCGSTFKLAVHEIAKGHSNREAALPKRYCWLVLCVTCNCQDFCDYQKWPLTRQLALKWLHDWENFYLVAFNLLRRRSSEAITFTEVVIEICRLQDGGR